MSEPLSDEQLAEIAARVTACGACNGIGTAVNCSDCLDGEVHTRCLEAPGPCAYCGGDGKSGDDEDAVALLAEVRRLREENDRLRDLNDGWEESANMANERGDAARADLARAIELLRGVTFFAECGCTFDNGCGNTYHAFLAEMEKR